MYRTDRSAGGCAYEEGHDRDRAKQSASRSPGIPQDINDGFRQMPRDVERADGEPSPNLVFELAT